MSSEFARHLTHLTLDPLTNVTAVDYLYLKNGSSPGQNLALTGLNVPNSLDGGYPLVLQPQPPPPLNSTPSPTSPQLHILNVGL